MFCLFIVHIIHFSYNTHCFSSPLARLALSNQSLDSHALIYWQTESGLYKTARSVCQPCDRRDTGQWLCALYVNNTAMEIHACKDVHTHTFSFKYVPLI